MSGSFAGSRNLDERRRRWIAACGDDAASNAGSPRARRNDAVQNTAEAGPARPIHHLPLRKVISRRQWKCWGVGICLLLCTAGLLAAEGLGPSRAAELGPAFPRLFQPGGGPVSQGFASLLLFLTGQLALLIGWVRSCSPEDYGGQYRMWWWAAGLGFLGSMTAATGAHTAWSETYAWLWGRSYWNQDVLCWLLPGAALTLWMLASLHREMCDCKSSLTILWLAVACWSASSIILLGIPLPHVLEASRIVNGGFVIGTALAFFGLLLHARHVIYETADPPAYQPRRWEWLSRLRFPSLKWPALRFTLRRRNRSTEDSQAPEDSDVGASAAKKSKASRSTARKQSTRSASKSSAKATATAGKAKSSTSSSPPKETSKKEKEGGESAAATSPPAKFKADAVTAEASPPAAAPTEQKSPSPTTARGHDQPDRSASAAPELEDDEREDADDDGRRFRVDASHEPDPPNLAGLSKRERRKLRKQMQSQNRSSDGR